MRKSLPVLLLVPLLIIGCGGRASSSASSRGKGGSAVVTLQWPARTRLVPLSSNSAVVEIAAPRTEAQTRLVVRAGDAASLGKATFTGLVPGSYTVTVKTFPSADGTGTAQAAGTAPLEVTNEGARLTATLDSTVASLALSAPAGTVEVGGTLALVASAKDKDGNLVLLASDGISERLDWGVSPAGAAMVQGTGPSVVLTGVAPADATVTARLRVKDDGTTVDATLPVRVTRPVVASGLATAGWPIEGGGYGRLFAGRGPAASGTLAATDPAVDGLVVGPDGTLYRGAGAKLSARGAANWDVADPAGTTYGSLAITGNGVLLVRSSRGLFARDAATGALLWSFVPSSSPYRFVVGRDGTVYAIQSRSTVVLDGATGTLRRTMGAISVRAVGEDGALYGFRQVGLTNPTFYLGAYDPASGDALWERNITGQGINRSNIAVSGGSIYLRQSVKVGALYYGRIEASSTVDGSPRWTVGIAEHTGSVPGAAEGLVAVRDGRAFAQNAGMAVGIDAATGRKLWEVPAGGGPVATAADGTVYCALGGTGSPTAPNLGLLALDPATGATRWSLALGSGAGTPNDLALADDGTVYVDTGQGLFTVR